MNKYKLDPNNTNKHTERGNKALKHSIEKAGYGRSIVVDKNGKMIGGEAVYKTTELIPPTSIKEIETTGDELVVVKRVDLDMDDPEDDRARLLSVYDNRAAELGLQWDGGAIRQLIDDGLDLSEMFTKIELEELFNSTIETAAGTISETDPETAADKLQERWGVERGDLYRIGDHYLLCGDATNIGDVERLVSGEKPTLFITDPPYGVDYSELNKARNKRLGGNRIETPITNDAGSVVDMETIWFVSFNNAYQVTAEKASYYVFSSHGRNYIRIAQQLLDAGWDYKQALIWVKNNHVIGNNDYSYKHEPIFYGWKQNSSHNFYGGFQTSVLEFSRPNKQDLHPTMKPTELLAQLITNSSAYNDYILDLFAGAGSSMVAAQSAGRRCYGMELEPAYCAVTLERMSQFQLDIEKL